MTTAPSSPRSDRLAALVLLVALSAVAASAHRRDEYLQAARLGIDPDSVELTLDLTPGIAVAGAVLDDIDGDRDGSISTSEKQAYAARVMAGLALELDGRTVRVRLVDIAVATPDAMRRGEGTTRIRAVAALPELTPGVHQLHFRNGHRRDISVYLANALIPGSPRIQITAQRRDAGQRELIVDYRLER